MCDKVKLFGKVTDFMNNPLSEAFIRVQDETFRYDIANTFTDQNGYYELLLDKGTYSSVWICQDYQETQLEYWARNVPIFSDLELNARVDGLEVYGGNVFRIHGYNQLMIYFRPMSLKRGNFLRNNDLIKSLQVIDTCPNLTFDNIHISVNNHDTTICQISKVRESIGNDQFMYSYLVQIDLNSKLNIHDYNKIHISILDEETGERGEGSIFWKDVDTVLHKYCK